MNVTDCFCKIGSKFYPEGRMNINYGTNNYNEAFKEAVNFKKDYNGLPRNIKSYINHRTFKSSYRVYVFDTRYQNDHIGPQPARHENCDMIYLKQRLFSADRQNVRENCNLFIFFEQTGKAVTAI